MPGPAATSVLKGLFDATAFDITLAAAGLVTSVDALLIPSPFSSDASSAAGSVGAGTNFGLVDGTLMISNGEGPVLSGLTGVGAGNSGAGTNTFTSIADPNGDYSLILPLGNNTITYNTMTISAFDPISDLTLASSTVDLSSLNPEAAMTGPGLSGVFNDNDTDASDPDADDPDCD